MILITGASGFVGRSLGRALTHNEIPWRAYSGRMNAPADLRRELEGVITVIHLAGSEARGRNRQLQHVDVEGTERLIEEARRAGVSHIIYPSRLNADPHASHRLLRTKGQVERLIQRSGIPYTIVRSSTLFGRDDRFSEMILSLALWSWPFVWLPGGGKTAMQPLWVEDFVRCLMTLTQNRAANAVLTVAGSERMSYADIAGLILETAGVRRIRLPIPMALVRPLAGLMTGWWYWPGVSRYMVDRFFVSEVADLGSVNQQFGFRPARFGETITFLRRSGMSRRLFRH